VTLSAPLNDCSATHAGSGRIVGERPQRILPPLIFVLTLRATVKFQKKCGRDCEPGRVNSGQDITLPLDAPQPFVAKETGNLLAPQGASEVRTLFADPGAPL
jgi:hypothetical protein